MSARESVLNVLRNNNLDNLNGLSVWAISLMTSYPEPTVRRTIAELKRSYTIVREGRRVRLIGFYGGSRR